ncbi:heterodisulfide reductase, subunit A, selenocysteine-containing [Desulforamulus reducens MI-1]|uniref:Heterodisulfide reductase, subunit A, selenocysteine-containing n=1 Tax=Desulforamulus reducens (strain ATCC BAA-1160 / DSM 100696 / MI-1) TaxID=349161 RepID=A4J0H9_DESRM|nr:hypothetical protein [Desulforamulus reducens]ABO48582.1 heterodisulfide reductase, subunit A, selenocysteine-containing [Desulforamulus reducens MI-1]
MMANITRYCRSVCPFKAIEEKYNERTKRTLAVINTSLCQGCGACSSSWRCGAADIKGFSNTQIISEILALSW